MQQWRPIESLDDWAEAHGHPSVGSGPWVKFPLPRSQIKGIYWGSTLRVAAEVLELKHDIYVCIYKLFIYIYMHICIYIYINIVSITIVIIIIIIITYYYLSMNTSKKTTTYNGIY